MFDEFLEHCMLSSFRFKFIAVKKKCQISNWSKKHYFVLEEFSIKKNISSEKVSEDKKFFKLAKEYKIIFWKRFEQFLDFAKIYKK